MIKAYGNPSSTTLVSTSKQATNTDAAKGEASAASSSKTASSLGPASQVEISDRTKTLLQQDQSNQSALQKLQTVISKLKEQASNPGSTKSGQTNTDPQSGPPQSSAMKMLMQVENQLFKQNTAKDGTISSFNATVRDFSMTPTNAAEVDNWYKNDGAAFSNSVSDTDTPEYKEMVQAIRNKEITFTDAKDIPDLNYHNQATFQGGEGGGAPGLSRTYNTQSSIFKDPERGYFVDVDGTVLSWKKQNSNA